MPSGACSKNRSRSPTSFPSAPSRVILDERGESLSSAAFAGQLAGLARRGPARGRVHHRRRRRARRRACATGPSSRSPSAPPPGRTSWCESCCWSSSTGRSRSCPDTPITGPERTCLHQLVTAALRLSLNPRTNSMVTSCALDPACCIERVNALAIGPAASAFRPTDPGDAGTSAARTGQRAGADAAAAAGEIPYLTVPRSQPPDSRPPIRAPAVTVRQARAGTPRDNLKQREQELEAIRAEQKRRWRPRRKLKREIEAIGDDRRKLNQQLIDTAARRARPSKTQIAATEERLAAARRPRAGAAQVARRPARRHRRGAGGAAAHRPPAAARHHGQAGGCAAIGALRDAARRRAAGDAAGGRDRSIADLAELGAAAQGDRRRARRASTAISPRSADERQRLTLLIDQRQKQQAETEKALDGRARSAPPSWRARPTI